MKKKRAWAGFLFLLISLFSGKIYAEEIQTVTLTENDKIIYEQPEDKLKEAFMDMAPGDTRTIDIRLQNDNNYTAAFFLSEKTVDAFEEANKSSGGAYEFTVSIGENEKSAVDILNTVAGGYTKDLKASTEGLLEITQLNDFKYLTKLAKGESTNLYLTLTLDGEGMDSTKDVDYSKATGALELCFCAYYEENGKTVIITENDTDIVKTNVTEKINFLPQSVKTGDRLSVALISVLAVSGIGSIWFALRKRREEGRK